MVSDGPSVLSLGAAGIYLVIVAACIFAAGIAARFRQPAAHSRIWVVIAFIFLVLAAMRVTAAEEALRTALRTYLQAEGVYAQRRDIQGLIAVLALLLGTAFGAVMLVRLSRRLKGWRNASLLCAVAAVMGMVLLFTLRVISLHQIDVLLYGPLKLNWVGDIGISMAVLAMAAFYMQRVRSRR